MQRSEAFDAELPRQRSAPLLKYSVRLLASKLAPELTNRTGLSSRLPAKIHTA